MLNTFVAHDMRQTLESRWADDKLVLRAIVPGVSEKDLKVSVQNNELVYGRFYAAVALPSGLDLEKVSCRLHDGAPGPD